MSYFKSLLIDISLIEPLASISFKFNFIPIILNECIVYYRGDDGEELSDDADDELVYSKNFERVSKRFIKST